MSEAVSNRIKQLEDQNVKFKKLLEATLQITSLDSAKSAQLKNDANFLRKVVSDLENQKKQLEDELNLHMVQDAWVSDTGAPINIQRRLNKALHDIQVGSTEIQQLQVEDDYLKELIGDLEIEKEQLLCDISLVKKANEENNALAQENLKLKQELALLQAQCGTKFPQSDSDQLLIKKLASLESMKLKLEEDIAAGQQCADPLGNPVESAVLELKISGLERQKEDILKTIRTNLLQAANVVSTLHRNTSDCQLRGLLHELDIHKTILMLNLSEVKEMHFEERANQEEEDHANTIKEDLLNCVQQQINMKEFLEDYQQQSEEYSTPKAANSGELLDFTDSELLQTSEAQALTQRLTGNFNYCELEVHELQPVSEEEELQEEQVTTANVLNCEGPTRGVGGEEEAQKLPLDDATNQMLVNEEQLLAQRIRELEEDNARIRRELSDSRSNPQELAQMEELQIMSKAQNDELV